MAYRQTPAVEARLQDNRTRILLAARALVSEGGWQEAQIANVATTAGIATGTVYRYFPSKAELFAQVLSRVSQREVDVLADIAASQGTAHERLHSMVTTFVLRAMRNPRLAYALIAEPCDKAIDEVRLEYRAAISEVIRSVIAQGQSNASMRRDVRADIAATVIVGGFMEGLIGPLSPLISTSQLNEADQRLEIAALADQIAALACTSVAASPSR
ncbi:TetR/AcrR family transcriptional regulator [Diaphorobacter aerolatus]|uniref:TetR/AcrR family transcriptional regulator n=1 Tax=Diaphorobacter aerolatus TaxID=1288495 RepID=A0A7H0GMZ6_9BURK|nr:TetR/AcrR family transcriptional regulator [Diaphorobacter aerolatus]QNP49662.1 TetR/AcrR family transcriptional regulator [Diaphorobacter aerolatus]